MRKFILLTILTILICCGSAFGQTCSCEDLQAQVDALSAQMDQLMGFLYAQNLGPLTPAQGTGDVVVKSGNFEQVAISDYTIDYKYAVLREVSFHASVIQLSVTFYNGSGETVRFADAVRMKAFQDGIGLREYYTNNLGYVDLRPGKSVTVTRTFILQDRITPVELEFGLISGDGQAIRMIDLGH